MINYYENYSPVGDVLTLAACIVFVALIRSAYINRTKNFLYLRVIIFLLFGSASSDMLYQLAMNHVGEIPNILIYIPRVLFHLGLWANLLLYVFYMKEPMHLDDKSDKRYALIAEAGYVVLALLEILGTITRMGFYIDENAEIHTGIPIFPVGYVFFIGMIAYMIAIYRDRVFRQVVGVIAFTMGICVLMICLQQIHGQSSFTVSTFVLPIFALMYMLHSNPYNIESGALGIGAYDDYIRNSYEKKRKFLIMSLFMPEFDGSNRNYPMDIMSTVRYFTVHFFKRATLFQISGGHLLLIADIKKNPDYNEAANKMIAEFNKVYPIYRKDYKIVSLMSEDKLSENRGYVEFIDYIHSIMPQNSVYITEEKDFKSFYDYKYIMSELKDIKEKKDLNDPRVEVYCQPVFNIKRGVYDTAESLMRLNLPELGMVFPDKFIPIAEKNGTITILTQIILNKTCRQIGTMLRHGYNVRRISVNFSIFDVREHNFCSMVEKIIRDNGIGYDKVAIEITETQNEADFELIKQRVEELKGSGIKFYLDDFGTGYSNFERIMELPFDIIKFDRSLVIASGTDDKIKEMVSHLAKMFSEMDYAVLYEGIEDEAAERRCKDMSAKYLQGYKYSKPIPIRKLTEYFEKTEAG